jgi:hypothetical protein
MAFPLGKIGIPIVNSLANIEFLIEALIRKLLESFEVCDILKSLPIEDCLKGIEKIIELRNNLVDLLIKIKSKLEDLKGILNIIQPILMALQAVIIVIKALPLPNQFTTTSVTTAFADIVNVLQDIVDTGNAIISSINFVLDKLIPKIDEFIKILSLLDIRLDKCIKDFSDKELSESNEYLALVSRGGDNSSDIANIQSKNIARLTNLLSPIPIIELGKSKETYKGFSFDIKVEKNIQGINQNYAIALDSRDIEVLKGRPSYSSSTKVLIDELKLVIDQQNLTGF